MTVYIIDNCSGCDADAEHYTFVDAPRDGLLDLRTAHAIVEAKGDKIVGEAGFITWNKPGIVEAFFEYLQPRDMFVAYVPDYALSKLLPGFITLDRCDKYNRSPVLLATPLAVLEAMLEAPEVLSNDPFFRHVLDYIVEKESL